MRFAWLAVIVALIVSAAYAMDPSASAATPISALQVEAAAVDASERSFCPAGYALRKKARGPKSTRNGCGSEATAQVLIDAGVKTLPNGYQACCNAHDDSYSRCGAKRSVADTALKACLLKAQEKHVSRTIPGKKGGLVHRAVSVLSAPRFVALPMTFYEAVSNFGGSAFKAGQEEACECAIIDTAKIGRPGVVAVSEINTAKPIAV